MKEKYADCVEKISSILFDAIVSREKNLPEKVHQIDRDLWSLLRAIGLRVMFMLLNWLINQVTQEFKQKGFVIHRRPKIKYTVIFGQLAIESPYLWDKIRKRGVRPVVEKLGISHGDRSWAVRRALTEFGVEESFEGAAKRFQEHYGFGVERNVVRREVETRAQQAETYIEQRFSRLQKQEKDPKKENQVCPRLVVELDGSQIRTGLYVSSQKEELTLYAS